MTARLLLITLLLQAWTAVHAVEVLDGVLTVKAPATATPGGTITVDLAFVAKDAKRPQRSLADRRVGFYLHPYRYSPFLPAPEALDAHADGAGRWKVTVPSTGPGWYYLAASVSTVPGEIPGADEADDEGQPSTAPDFDLNPRNPRSASMLICLRSPNGEPVYRVHAERGRCVFAQGEVLRCFASVRGVRASSAQVTLRLAGVEVARGTLAASAGAEAVAAFDLPAATTAALPAGRCDLILEADGREVDRLPVQVVTAEPASARARWWHGFPFGNRSANTSDPVTPRLVRSYRSWIEGSARDSQNANLWINWFSDGTPVLTTPAILPAVDDPAAPPSACEQRPAAVHALYELLMADGMACGAMLGGSEGGSENYHPFPTVDAQQIALVARKYQQAAQSLANHPNFTSVYLDAYGRPDWHGRGGNGDLSQENVDHARALIWEGGWKAAGATPPAGTEITLPRLPEDLATPEQRFRFLDYVMRGQERMYGAATRAIESVLPAVYTIHNHNRENHRQPFVYAFQDWSRSPSIAADFLTDAATVVASSEWNLDAEPQAYLLAAETTRVLMDRGRPVWRTAAFHFNGSSDRFLRDAVHLSGRGITPFYEQPGSATWSHQGADQSTFAAKDRLAAATEFLTTYEGLFASLEPVREVAFYLRPGWGDENSLSLITGLPAAWMSGYQAHVLTVGGILAGDLDRYRVLFAPGLTGPFTYPAETAAVKAWVAKGGRIIGAPAGTNRYRDLIDLARFGITEHEQPEIDKNGKPKIDKEGKPVIKRTYDDPMPARVEATRAAVWKDFPGVEVLPIDFTKQWARVDAEGQQVPYSSKAHWTGFQMWGNAAAPALAHAEPLGKAFAAMGEPLVVKDAPEVFVHAQRPRDGGDGLFLFLANFTVPKEASWTDPRVPYFFWPSYSAPVRCRVGIKDPDVTVVYDLMTAKLLPVERKDGRLWVEVDLTQVSGRVLACYRGPAAAAELVVPKQGRPGEVVQGTWTIAGQAPRLTSVRVRLRDAAGAVLSDVHRAVGADGKLPPVRLPDAAGPLRLEVLDTVSGLQAEATVVLAAERPAAVGAADPVTIVRGDGIHGVLKAANLRIAVCPGREDWGKEGRKLIEANPDIARDRAVAERLRAALAKAGITATIADPASVVADVLSAYPFAGNYRSRHTIPNRRIDGPVIVVGSPRSNAWLADMERAQVAPRSLGPDQVGGDRAVVAFAPRAFAVDADAILLVADADAGFDRAIAAVARLAAQDPGPDAWYLAREAVRSRYIPRDVAAFKTASGTALPDLPLAQAGGAPSAVAATPSDWPGLAPRTGSPVFALHASAGGVAVSLASTGTPALLVGPDGEIRTRLGGPGRAWARDVGISADGQLLIAGLALSAETVAVGADGRERWRHVSGVVHKDDIFDWETWKDSERFLALSPDRSVAVVSGGPEGVVCRDLVKGTVRWTLASDIPRDRPRGIACEELAISPEGRFALVYQQKKMGESPVLDKSGKPRIDAAGAPMVEEEFRKEAVLVDLATGSVRWRAPQGASGDWDLYTALGPEAAWNLVGGRGGQLGIRGGDGVLLRQFPPEQLPAELTAASMLPLLTLTGSPADRFLLSRAETMTICLMDLRLGSAAQRTASATALAAIADLEQRLGAELRDGKKQKSWTNESVDAFLAGIDLPADGKRLVGDKMKRFSSEARAGRKRDFRWIQEEFETALKLAFEQRRAVIEAACALGVRNRITTPARIHHLVASPDLGTVYAGLWDGTVRAYDTATGAERWKVDLDGAGCQLALTDGILYAGGTRGSLWRLDAATGRIAWRRDLALAER